MNNSNKQLSNILESLIENHDEFNKKLETLILYRDSISEKDKEEYFTSKELIDILYEEKARKETEITDNCPHRLYYLKHTNPYTMECACCKKYIVTEDEEVIKEFEKNNQLIIETKDQEKTATNTDEDDKYFIQKKYLEICTQIIKLEKALKQLGYEKYLNLIRTPEEVMCNYFNEKAKENSDRLSYFSSKTKRKYL